MNINAPLESKGDGHHFPLRELSACKSTQRPNNVSKEVFFTLFEIRNHASPLTLLM